MFYGTREHDHLLLGNKGYLKIIFREQGNIDCLAIGKTFLMCNREKGLSDDKMLAKYYNFPHFSGPGLGTNQIFCSSPKEL